MSIQPQHGRRETSSPGLVREASAFKALADPHRLAVLRMLARAQAAVCVCDITQELPLKQPTVSHHLGILREAGFITCERRGTWVYCRLAPGARERLGGALATIFARRSDNENPSESRDRKSRQERRVLLGAARRAAR